MNKQMKSSKSIQTVGFLGILSIYLFLSFSCKRPSNAVEEEHPFALEKSPQVFDPARSFQPGLADLDGDSDLDVVLPNMGRSFTRVLVNNGRGIFQDSGQDLGDGIENRGGYAIGLSDMYGDGDLDFVKGLFRDPARLFLNDGQGRFSDSGKTLPKNSFLGDLNGDGSLDAFVSNFEQPNQIWFNDGSGNFTDSGLRLSGEATTRGCALGDLDGDKDLDIFVANFVSGSNEIWFNR